MNKKRKVDVDPLQDIVLESEDRSESFLPAVVVSDDSDDALTPTNEDKLAVQTD